MKTTKLKTYAPEARRDFIQAVTDKAAFYGFTADSIEPMTEEGDVALIGGRPFSKAVGAKRKKLESRIKKQGFNQTMEAVAYTWFNRLVAIRYMELHEYLDHGYRVLSHPDGHNLPEIVEHAEHVDLPGLNSQNVVELKLDGTKEEELYRMLLVAQCNALHKAMPFLFESIDDDTELLLPDNLLHSDSLIRNLVNEIDEDDWQDVEVIGWLYQFYISEKKDEVIGKVVKSEDIPAATQLFTPNWIVKYLLQNSLGRQWMATYPNSPLKGQMEYYIEPAEQTPEVQAELDEITPTSLNPEELTLLDPACGSGHILVEAYDLLKTIYHERGYRAKDIPRLILEKNLFGLEIDDRAAQLAAFAVMMKARADDRSIFERDVQPQVLSIQDSKGMNAADITYSLNAPINKDDVPNEYLFEETEDEKTGLFSKKALPKNGHVSQADITCLLELFENAKTFGSLIQIPTKLVVKLQEIEKRLDDVLQHGDLTHVSSRIVKPLFQQARLLSKQYDAVVTNPPYMGGKAQNHFLKGFAKEFFPTAKADVFAMFIERGFSLGKQNGTIAYMTPFVWLFINSYERLRKLILRTKSISTLVHPEYNTFWESAHVTICAFVINNSFTRAKGDFIDLRSFIGAEAQQPKLREAASDSKCQWRHSVSSISFEEISGCPIAYWASDRVREVYSKASPLDAISKPRTGISTGNNDECIFYWWEPSLGSIGFGQNTRSTAYRFYPHNKGGGFRRWFGNCLYVLKYSDADISRMESYKGFRHDNRNLYCQPSVSWGKITSSSFSARYYPEGFTFDGAGLSLFFDSPFPFLALLNSNVFSHLLGSISCTLNFTVGDIGRTPILDHVSQAQTRCKDAIHLSHKDWNESERSWDHMGNPLLTPTRSPKIETGWKLWESECGDRIEELLQIEVENNRLFIKLYELDGELSPEVPEDRITLYRPDREEDIKRLISYSIGCMLGRYSLDEPGLIYAQSSNVGFDSSKYETFAADEDGIIPLTEFLWFEDDAASRFEKFVRTAWPKERLEENLKFIAKSLGNKKGESSRDSIRQYLATGFYKHHLPMYKKRPIYWLFSSGKQRGFQALVYLHRYNEGTLARMRTEYVIPLLGKMTARIDQLTDDIAGATSTPHQKRMEKEKSTVTKQLAEVQSFDEKLRHYADQTISIDLDDGVKVNYGKFGTLLAEVKAVTGTKPNE